MLLEHFFTLTDCRCRDEARRILVIRFGFPLFVHQFQNPFADGDAVEDLIKFSFTEAVFLLQFLKEFLVAGAWRDLSVGRL